MDDKYIEVLEKLNSDYIDIVSSREYKIGSDIKKIKQTISKGNFIDIFKSKRRRKKISKLNSHQELDNDYGLKYTSKRKPKIAVYTCISGNYDKLYSPLLKPDNIDYFAFLENESRDKIGYWNVKKIPEEISKLDNILKNRYIKLHPYELFNNYDYSIYIDGNIQVISDLTDMVCSVTDTGISLHHHQFRNCICNEIEVCRLLKKGNYDKLKSQVDRYLDEGFPKSFGLYECNVILCDLKNATGEKLMKDWWNEFLKTESYRDQISFPYVIWKNKLKFDDIGCLGKNVYKNPKLRIMKHG